jgi:outer membrane protein assembly factor BamB
MGDRRGAQFVIALDAATGKELWSAPVGGPHDDQYAGPRGTPTVDGALLYAIGTDGNLVCLESATGRERWRKNMPRDFRGRMMSSWMYAESPLVDQDRVVVSPGGPGAALVSLDKATGREIWRGALPQVGRNGADGAGYSSIVISQGGGVKQYVQLMGRGLVSFRASDGFFMWANNDVANSIANISTPVVKDNFVFASTGYETGAVLVEVKPAPEGRVTAETAYFLRPSTLQNHHGGFVLLGDYLYGGHGQSNGFPFALELRTGRMAWPRVRGAGSGSAAVTAADGRLYFRYQNGVMALIEASPSAYNVTGTFEIPDVRQPSWSHPVVAGGRLYLREQDALHVYQITR